VLDEKDYQARYEHRQLIQQESARLRKIYGKHGDISDMPYSEEIQAFGRQIADLAGRSTAIRIALQYLDWLEKNQ